MTGVASVQQVWNAPSASRCAQARAYAATAWRISSRSTALSHHETVNTAKPPCFFAHAAAEAARHVSIANALKDRCVFNNVRPLSECACEFTDKAVSWIECGSCSAVTL